MTAKCDGHLVKLMVAKLRCLVWLLHEFGLMNLNPKQLKQFRSGQFLWDSFRWSLIEEHARQMRPTTFDCWWRWFLVRQNTKIRSIETKRNEGIDEKNKSMFTASKRWSHLEERAFAVAAKHETRYSRIFSDEFAGERKQFYAPPRRNRRHRRRWPLSLSLSRGKFARANFESSLIANCWAFFFRTRFTYEPKRIAITAPGRIQLGTRHIGTASVKLPNRRNLDTEDATNLWST